MFHIEGIINGKQTFIGSNDGEPIKLTVRHNHYSGEVEMLKNRVAATTGRIGIEPTMATHDYLECECAAYVIAWKCFDTITNKCNNYNHPYGMA
jgi:hypothetical protein